MKNMEDTYILTYRSILNWRWADNPYMMALWWRLLLEANFADNDWQDMVIKRGQLVTSIAKLSVESGLSTKQVRMCLERLKKTGEIGLETTNKYTIITICKYDDYQSLDQQQGQTNGKQTANGGQTEGKQGANKGQQDNKSNKSNKGNEGNEEIKKENLLKEKSFVPPTVDEVNAYIQEKGYEGITGETFVSYYEMNGWKVGKNKMKDWRAGVRYWVQRDKAEKNNKPKIDTSVCYKSRDERTLPDGRKIIIGYEEWLMPDGTRTYLQSGKSVPYDAPPRSYGELWSDVSKKWVTP